MRYIFIPFLVFMCLVSPLSARRTIVTTATSINTGKWSAGDTIVLKNGNWTNQAISLRAFGTALKPIVLIAATPGEVFFNGSSRIAISGTYIEVSGIIFKDGLLNGTVFSFNTSTSNVAENCRLTNCAIINYTANLQTDNTKWVSLLGKNNRVDNCTFENKTNIGTLLTVGMTPGVIPAHIIENNYFGYRNPYRNSSGSILNGQEIIRIGSSTVSMQYANCIVRNNIFEKCNGEAEIISSKTCGNIYSNNVFLECQGMLTLRHGNDCTVEGNYFFGNGVSTTGGVRIIGEDQKVYNNYFENLRGTNAYAGLCMVSGTLNSLPHEYFQIKNAFVAFNTFVNCAQAFCINFNSSITTEPPINSVIAHNHVYNTDPTRTNVFVEKQDANMDITWKNNLMNQGKYTSFTYNSTQIITGKDAQMQEVETPIVMVEPTTGSALTNYKTNDFANVPSDIRGRPRNKDAKIPGASQIDGVTTREMPSRNSVGAVFSTADKIHTDFGDGTWGAIAPTLPAYGSFGSYSFNGFDLEAAVVLVGSTTCSNGGPKHMNRIALDRVANGGKITFPTVNSVERIEIHAYTSSTNNPFKLTEFNRSSNTWDIVGDPIMYEGDRKQDSVFIISVSRTSPTKFRIESATSVVTYLTQITSHKTLGTPIVGDATDIGLSYFTAHWSVVPNAKGYKVSVYNGTTLVSTKEVSGQATNELQISGLSEETSYIYKVQAVGNGTNDSSLSTASEEFTMLTTTALKDISTSKLIISGKTITASEIGVFDIYDLQGSKVYQVKSVSIATTNLAVGLYILQYTDLKGRKLTQKITIN